MEQMKVGIIGAGRIAANMAKTLDVPIFQIKLTMYWYSLEFSVEHWMCGQKKSMTK